MQDASEGEQREHLRQRRRRPRVLDDASVDVNSRLREVRDLIPEIGAGYRWYDYAYRALNWLSNGWRSRVSPRFVRTWLNDRVNALFPFNEHDRNRAWRPSDPMHGFAVPPGEHVRTAGIWVLELFPPTELPALEVALQKNGWNRRRFSMPSEDANAVVLQKSRSGKGALWWRLATVARKDSTWFVPDAIRMSLPSEFEFIELRAIQVGDSLTAVLAEFHLSESASVLLDEVWHRRHEPVLLKRKPRRRALDQKWATFRKVQSTRADLHNAARSWLADRLQGFFVANDEPQPLLDLVLTEKFDPTRAPRTNEARSAAALRSDAFRALGISDRDYYQATSPDLPKLVLAPGESRFHEWLGSAPTWTLWGKREAILKALGDDRLAGYSDDPNRAIPALVDNMNNLFVMLGTSEFLSVTQKRYAELRDRASSRHGKFRPGALRELRQNFLTLSLNLSSVRADVDGFWGRKWRWEGDAQFAYEVAPRYRLQERREGRKPEDPIDLNTNLRESQQALFERLSVADRDYRSILSTVASLGASADSYRLGRFALVVAIASLVVALMTVLLVDFGGVSLIDRVWDVPSVWPRKDE